METSLKVYQAIANVQADLCKTGISKDRQNVQQGYAFRGIDDCYAAVAPLLSKHGLCILPNYRNRVSDERASKNGGTLNYVTVEGVFDFVAVADGSKHTVTIFGEAMDSGDKATNKSQSASYKYACLQVFCIPTEGDNDADATTPEPAARRTTPTAAKTPAKKSPTTAESRDKMIKELLEKFDGETIWNFAVKVGMIVDGDKLEAWKDVGVVKTVGQFKELLGVIQDFVDGKEVTWPQSSDKPAQSSDWRSYPAPKFMKVAKLGDLKMDAQGIGYWIHNFTVKDDQYKENNQKLRDALDAAGRELGL